ncbi:MAG: serine/threonine protein phosphatase [Clostridia bacterium]|nr:serine/threonine protein phosphatase [Clostridia bacterium]
MKIFKKKAPEPIIPVKAIDSIQTSHPFREIKAYSPNCKNEMRLYSLLREAVPIIDAAINKTVRLAGGFQVICTDEEIQKDINKFLANIKVNASSVGAESFLSIYLDQLLTFGTSVGEIVLNADGSDISALYNASLKDIELALDKNPLNLKIYRKEKNKLVPLEFPELVLVSSLNAEPGKAYGTSILKGLPFISGILLTIYNTLGVNWDRVGNLRFAVTYKPSSDAGEKAYAKERAMQVAKEWQKTMSPNSGVSDFISVGDVSIKVIGADNQILDSQIPVKQMLEQIVAKLSIPPFLLGLSWSTTEKMSAQQADILTSELEYYRRILSSVITKVCNLWLKVHGCFTDFEIIWDNINLQDEVELANARLTRAKAIEIEKRLEI